MCPVTKHSHRVVLSCFLGWTFDAFDFFLMVFLLSDVATAFHTGIENVSVAIMLTLAFRPVGAFFFGRMADHYGRRPALMTNVLIYSTFGFLTAFSPSLWVFLLLRSLFGIAMGGEWGVGAALSIEAAPTQYRGLVSGLLQSGYPMGYLLASLAFYLLHHAIGWRGMFMLSLLPGLLIFYIRRKIPESAEWLKVSQPRRASHSLLPWIHQHFMLVLFAIALMTGFNFLSHGSQDLYPTFLKLQHHLDSRSIGSISLFYNAGAIIGGIAFGRLSQKIGRCNAILFALLLVLLILPFWTSSSQPMGLALTAFLMQVGIQGAWGVIPVYLNELFPVAVRGTLPGFCYQAGNLIASVNAVLQTWLAERWHGAWNLALSAVVCCAAIYIAGFLLFFSRKVWRRTRPMKQ